MSLQLEWYALSFEPRQSFLASDELHGRGLNPYLPLEPKRERHGRGALRTVHRPMFGEYMFVQCEPTAQHWNYVNSARGVRHLLGPSGKPLPLDGHQIEVIKLVETEMAEAEERRVTQEQAERIAKAGGRSGIVWPFTPGERVRIKAGPFASFYAQLEGAVDTSDRIMALISIFGRQSRTELSAFDIEKAGATDSSL